MAPHAGIMWRGFKLAVSRILFHDIKAVAGSVVVQFDYGMCVRRSLSNSSIRSVWAASTIQVRAMLAHAILIGMERASRAKRPHSFELDRHSVAESIDHTICTWMPSPLLL